MIKKQKKTIKVLLLSTVTGVAKAGEFADVSQGFYFNYLGPKNLAKPVQKGSEIDEKSNALIEENRKKEVLANELLDKISQIPAIDIYVTANESDIVLEKVTKDTICNGIKFKYGIDIKEHGIRCFLQDHVRLIGEYVLVLRTDAREIKRKINLHAA